MPVTKFPGKPGKVIKLSMETAPTPPHFEKGMGNMTVILEDKMTPATATGLRNFEERLEQAHALAAVESKMFLIESWADMQKEKPVINPYSLLAKRWYGKNDPRALVLTGQLEKAIWSMDFHFIKGSEGSYAFVQDMKIPWYMFIHEYGAKPKVTAKMRAWAINALGWPISKRKQVIKIPRRQFFVRATRKAMNNFAKRIQMALRLASEDWAMVEMYPPIVSSSDVPINILKYDLDYGNVGAALFFVPPQLSPALAAWGGYGDVSSFMQGQFTTNLAIMYARSMALGRAGITKKMIRRRIRGDVIFKRAD